MLKKGLIIGGVSILLLLIAFIGYKQIRERSLSQKADLYAAVSDEAVLILETRNMMKFSKTLLYENDFWKLTGNINTFENFNQLVKQADVLFTQYGDIRSMADRQLLIVFNAPDKDITNLQELITFKCTSGEAEKCNEYIQAIIDPTRKSVKQKYNSTNVYAFPDSTAQQVFFTSYLPGMFIGSFYRSEVEKAIDMVAENKSGIKSDSTFNAIKTTAGKNVPATLFINTKQLFPAVSEKLSNNHPVLKKKLNTFSNWMELDITIDAERLLVNGYSNKGQDYFTSLFDGQEPVTSEICKRLPLKTAFFTFYGISNPVVYKDKLIERKTGQKADKVAYTPGELFIADHFSGQAVFGYTKLASTLKKNDYVMLSVKDSTLAADKLESIAGKITDFSPYTYQEIKIYQLPVTYKLTDALGELASLSGVEYAAFIGNYILITTSVDLMTELAGQILAGYSLTMDNSFTVSGENYDQKSTMLSYVNYASLVKYAKEIFEKSIAAQLTGSDQFSSIQDIGWQMENERDMIYHNAFIRFGEPSGDSVVISHKKANRLLWEIDFESKPVYGPVIVRNQITGRDEILVQDSINKLCFYDAEGKFIWSRQLDAPIMGNKMYQIDYYKNRKYQFVFNTAKQLYILDRKGNLVEQYPIDLLFEASAPVSVFDYENNFDYRFFVPGKNKKIYLYKKDGIMPTDWLFEETANVLSLPVQYISIDDKDYLFVNDGNRPYILSRKGKERIKIKSDFTTSVNNMFYLQKIKTSNYVLTTDHNGYIKQIGMNGDVRSVKVKDNLSANHYFFYTQAEKVPAYVFVDKNNIAVYNQDIKQLASKNQDENDLLPILFKDRLTVYAPSTGNIYAYNLNDLKKDPQLLQSGMKPCVGSLSPMPKNYIITYQAGKLRCFELY